MHTIIVRPRNKQELALVSSLLKKMDIRTKVISAEKERKKKAKKEFLDSLPCRLKEVELHMQGKIELPTWDEVVKDDTRIFEGFEIFVQKS